MIIDLVCCDSVIACSYDRCERLFSYILLQGKIRFYPLLLFHYWPPGLLFHHTISRLPCPLSLSNGFLRFQPSLHYLKNCNISRTLRLFEYLCCWAETSWYMVQALTNTPYPYSRYWTWNSMQWRLICIWKKPLVRLNKAINRIATSISKGCT